MKFKKTKIEGIEIFKIPVGIKDQAFKVNAVNFESKKTADDLLKRLKSGNGKLFLSDYDGNAFQCIHFTHKNQTLAGIAPNLVQAYFDLAYEHIQWTDKYKETLLNTASNKFDPIKVVHENIFNRFIQYRISGIIFLHLTIEAFLNHIIPDDFIFEKKELSKNNKFLENITKYNKSQIERWFSFKEKLDEVLLVIPNLKIDNTKFKPLRDKLIQLSKIRDEIIHLKSKDHETQAYYIKVFDFVTSNDLSSYVKSVSDFVNLCSSDFIQLYEIDDERESFKITVEEPQFLSFAVLLEVVKRKFEKIDVIITKTKDFNKYSEVLKFILNHLPLLEKTNCIIDYHVRDLEKEIIIEFYKSPDQIK